LSQAGSRWQRSVSTFGPVGRVTCTLILIGVVALFLFYAGPMGFAGAAVWCGWVLPRGLRDTWRRAALPSSDLTRLRDDTARQLAEQARPGGTHPVFDETMPPSRW
jgi:hypothetical protein